MPATSRKRGSRSILTRDEVIEAALGLVDAHGLEALNVRKLAASLGVSTMTPYTYLADKADLRDAMVAHALGALAVDPASTASWDVQVEVAMRGLHDALAKHPGVVELLLAESDAARLEEFRAALIELLMRAGLSHRRSADALRTLTSYVVGYSIVRRLRARPLDRLPSPDSFDDGVHALMDAIRREVADAQRDMSA